MRIIRGQHSLAAGRGTRAPGAVTVGNFDGVHRGHQKVIAQISRLGAADGLVPRVVIFEPQPNEFFAAGEPPARLTRLSEKLRLFARLGVTETLVLRFDAAFSAMDAGTFVRDILVAGLNVKRLVIGDDFQFGRGREGDFSALTAFGADFGFSVTRADTFELGGARVSSTRIRNLLAEHRLAEAADLLGRPYSISGRVVHGRKEGRTIGFPTANIHLGRRRVPISGIFAVRVHGIAGHPLPGSAYVGSRPVVEDDQIVLEVHLFDFDEQIYGRRIEVEFVGWIRDDLALASMTELKAQIARDNIDARRILATAAA